MYKRQQSEIAEVLPLQLRTDLDKIEAAIEGRPAKKKKKSKVASAVFLVFTLLFTWLSLYLFLQGAGTAYRALNLRIRGQKDTAEVIQIACEMRPQKNDDIQKRAEYTYFEVVTFTTDTGKAVSYTHLALQKYR